LRSCTSFRRKSRAKLCTVFQFRKGKKGRKTNKEGGFILVVAPVAHVDGGRGGLRVVERRMKGYRKGRRSLLLSICMGKGGEGPGLYLLPGERSLFRIARSSLPIFSFWRGRGEGGVGEGDVREGEELLLCNLGRGAYISEKRGEVRGDLTDCFALIPLTRGRG